MKIIGKRALVLLAGIVFLFVGIIVVKEDITAQQNGFHTSGKIVEINSTQSSKSRTIMYSPIVEFKDKDNNVIREKMNYSTSLVTFSIGETIELVHYDGKVYTKENFWVYIRYLIPLIGIIVILMAFSPKLK